MFNEKPAQEDEASLRSTNIPDQDNKNSKERPEAILRTSMGDITFDLYKSESPKTVYNFIELSKKGYYDGLKLHRVIKRFMMQTGDPNGI